MHGLEFMDTASPDPVHAMDVLLRGKHAPEHVRHRSRLDLSGISAIGLPVFDPTNDGCGIRTSISD